MFCCIVPDSRRRPAATLPGSPCILLCRSAWRDVGDVYRVGNCMLIAKPRAQGQAPYDSPSILDFNDFGDVEGYRDHSRLTAHSLRHVGPLQNQEISVAVHNYADAAILSVRSDSREHHQQCNMFRNLPHAICNVPVMVNPDVRLSNYPVGVVKGFSPRICRIGAGMLLSW